MDLWIFFKVCWGLWEWSDHGEVVKNVTGSCQGVADVFGAMVGLYCLLAIGGETH